MVVHLNALHTRADAGRQRDLDARVSDLGGHDLLTAHANPRILDPHDVDVDLPVEVAKREVQAHSGTLAS